VIAPDGRRQRRAFTAAQRSIELLAAGDGAGARRASGTASELDQMGAYADLAAAIEAASSELDTTGALSAGAREAVRAAVPPGPLAAAAEALLGGR
jgi:hypothetical protein